MAGNHNDLFDIENVFQKMVEDMKSIGINPDACFDSQGLREICEGNSIIASIGFNKRNSKTNDNKCIIYGKLYKECFSVERTNAWIDAFKVLLVRFKTKVQTWVSLHYLAFTLILLRKKI